MSWRPEGWNNPYMDLITSDEEYVNVFEEGAEAMLEALKSKGVELNGPGGIEIIGPDQKRYHGYLLLIPVAQGSVREERLEFTIPVVIAAQIVPNAGKLTTSDVKVTLEGSYEAILTLQNDIEEEAKQRKESYVKKYATE